MKLLSPLADKWDEGRAAYRWAALEDMARMIKLEFPDAHDAAADVRTTISVMCWAYAKCRNGCGPDGRHGSIITVIRLMTDLRRILVLN